MQRIDDEHMCRRGIGVGFRIARCVRHPIDMGERRGQPERSSGDLGTRAVGFKFARATDRHLHQDCGDGRQERNNKHTDQTQRTPPAAEEEGEVREHRNGAGNRRGDRHRQRVAVLHMTQFMRQYAGQFFVTDVTQKSARHTYRSVLRIATGGERIGLGVVDNANEGHRNLRRFA